MKIKDIMTNQVKVLSPGDSLIDCAKKMKSLSIGAFPVAENDRLKGMITDRDIVVKAVADGLDLKSAFVRDVMTVPISYCFEEDEVDLAVHHMKTKRVRRLVVLNKDKRLVGIVSLKDIATKGPSKELTGETLEKISRSASGEKAAA